MESGFASGLPHITGLLLTLSFPVFMVGGLLFTVRNGMAGNPAPNYTYLVVERGFVMAAAVIAALGLILLAVLLGQVHVAAANPASLSATIYVVATSLILIGEGSLLSQRTFLRKPVIAFVVLAFLAQAAFGGILVWTGFLPSWIGWFTISWNLAWLVILPVFSPRDMYYPVLHHVVPLLLGVSLLMSR